MMELKDLILNMVNDKAGELGNDPNKAIVWLAEFAALSDTERMRQLEEYKANKKIELEANKSALAKQKIDAEKNLTERIALLDNIEVVAVAPEA